MRMSKSIYQVLDELGVTYQEHTHPAVFTTAEADQHWASIPGTKTKNLFLRNRKGDVHYLVIVPAEKRLDLKQLAKTLGESQLGFASPERLKQHLGLTPGSVTPFGLINDQDQCIRVLVDQAVADAPMQGFHPLINTATLSISTQDLFRFFSAMHCSVDICQLDTLTEDE